MSATDSIGGSAARGPAAGESVRVFDLSAGIPSVALEEIGLRIRSRPRRHHPLVLYEDVTHVAATGRGFWLGTRRGVFFARRQRFRAADGPEQLTREIVGRVAARPGGMRQLSHIAEIDALARRHPRPRVVPVVAAICLAVFGLQLADSFVEEVWSFDPPLFLAGQWWRLWTANFVHGLAIFPIHLLFNLIGLVGFGYLVERSLGAARVAAVLAASAASAMGATALVRAGPVVGASGLVAGLAGAALCMELHFADRLPAWWRLPRRLFIGLLLLQAFIDYNVEVIAGEAHLGGFAAGYVTTLLVARSALLRRPASAGLRRVAAGAAAVLVAAFAMGSPLLLRDPGALAHHATQLLAVEDVEPSRDNEVAWRMATESDASPEQLQLAVALAARAVDKTLHRNPDVLDTLAETLFASGDARRAIEVIDEAIALSPGDPYFREQRRRFLGERDADDRPEAPPLPWPFRRAPELGPAPEPGEPEGEIVEL